MFPPQRKRSASRVCMLVFSGYPSDPRVRREAMALQRAGVGVDVHCLRLPGESEQEVCDGVQVYRILQAPVRKDSLGPYLWHTLRFTLRALISVSGKARARGYRLYHTHTMPDFLIFACLLGKWQGKPLILDLHDLSVELFAAKLEGPSRRLLWLVALQERLACRFADHLITTSWGFRERLLARGNPDSKLTLVFNSADPKLFQFDDERRFEPIGADLRLLYHGTIAERFGLHRLIEALPRIRSRHRDVQLWLFGKSDPGYQSRLESLVADLGLEAHVAFGGWQPAESLPDLFRDAHLAVVPYLRDAFMELAISTKTFEYAATGLPVVTTRLAAMTSIFPEQSLTYVAPDDAEALAEGVLRLAADPLRRASQRRLAHRVQQAMNGEVMAARYRSLVSDLMGTDTSLLASEDVSR